MMEACRDCHACRTNCPTHAIPSDRFVLRADLCLVFHNEKTGDIPFPTWMNPSWHNSVIGCMLCQRVCPENVKFILANEEREEFSEEETAMLLKGADRDRLPAATTDKLRHLDLLEDLGLLPRNLGVFFE
jgi:epoxyqueuosine reductase